MRSIRKHSTLSAVTTALCVVFGTTAWSQSTTTSQVLTLCVRELNAVDLVGSALRLRVAGVDQSASQPMSAADGSTKLIWTSNGENRKITVATDNLSPHFSLTVKADQIEAPTGIASPVVKLQDGNPHDLILGLSRSAGSCTLSYVAVAEVEKGAGTESHLVTFTITGS